MTQIFVGNLSYTTTSSDLREAFERFGKVEDARVVTEAGGDRSRGFGFVEMDSVDDAVKAIHKMSGMQLHGRKLTVNEARDARSEDPNMPKQRSSEQEKLLNIFESL